MPSLIIDDANTTLIQYTGNWQKVPGSTRQWEGGVHVTGELNAKATFGFRGYSLKLYGTIPAGTGSSLVDISLDGGKPTVSSKTSNGSAIYDQVFYDSGLLGETFHTVVITNRGATADGYTEFMLDRFQFETSDEIPVFPSLTPSPSGSVPPTDSPTGSVEKKTNSTPLIAAGVVVGVLVIALAIFGVFLLKTRRKLKQFRSSNYPEKGKGSDASVPVPFPPSNEPEPNTPAAHALSPATTADPHSPFSEKAALRTARSNTTMSPSVSAVPISSTDSSFPSSSSNRPQPSENSFSEAGSRGASALGSHVSRSDIGSSPLVSAPPVRASVEKKALAEESSLSVITHTVSATSPGQHDSANSPYDNPPPSYWTQP